MRAACFSGGGVDVGVGAADGLLPVTAPVAGVPSGTGPLCGLDAGAVVASVRPAPAPGWLDAVAAVAGGVGSTVLGVRARPVVAVVALDPVVLVEPETAPWLAVGSAGLRGLGAGLLDGLGTSTPTTERASEATRWAGAGKASAAARLPSIRLVLLTQIRRKRYHC